MPTPGEHKTVQARILEYAEAIGWTYVSREEAEQRRCIAPIKNEKLGIKNSSLFFDDLLDANVREFNTRYAEAECALFGQFCHLRHLRQPGQAHSVRSIYRKILRLITIKVIISPFIAT